MKIIENRLKLLEQRQENAHVAKLLKGLKHYKKKKQQPLTYQI